MRIVFVSNIDCVQRLIGALNRSHDFDCVPQNGDSVCVLRQSNKVAYMKVTGRRWEPPCSGGEGQVEVYLSLDDVWVQKQEYGLCKSALSEFEDFLCDRGNYSLKV